jgi:hypothetical protein
MPAKIDTSAFEITGQGNRWYLRDKNNETIEAFGSEAEARSKLQSRAQSQQKDVYTSAHFPQANILAHLRVNDRVDADGKKMLLIEEVQSDWHQAGRDKGYKSDVNPEENKVLVKQWDALTNERRDLERIVATGDDADPAVQNAVQRLGEISNELNAVNDRLTQVRTAFREGVPDAPFKDTWYQLALKRAIQHAAENGYDRIGLTTGSQQASRFDLSKQVDRIEYFKYDDGKYGVSAIRGGDPVFAEEGVTLDRLGDLVGKEVANKIKANEGQEVKSSYGKHMVLSGLDLKVGGEGMKKYYDEIYPKFLDKYGKKWGARVGDTKIRTQSDKQVQEDLDLLEQLGEDRSKFSDSGMERVRYIDITPEMKAGVSKGQPLFMAAPIGAGLLGSESMTPER